MLGSDFFFHLYGNWTVKTGAEVEAVTEAVAGAGAEAEGGAEMSNQMKSNNFIYTRFSHQYIFMNRNIYKTYNTMNQN